MPVAFAKSAFANGAYCGDECAYWHSDGRTILCIVDGLGHGEQAAQAALAAVEFVAGHLTDSLEQIFAGCDAALRETRGVAMGLSIIKETEGTLSYAAVGNTRVQIVRNPKRTGSSLQTASLLGSFGIIGNGYKPLTPKNEILLPGDLLILYTDGVQELLDLSSYGRELLLNVQRLANRINDDWRTGTDDAAVLVYKKAAPPNSPSVNSGNTILQRKF